MTDVELLVEAGHALYGDRWQTDMAQLLHVNDRTVRYWVAGKFSPPPAVWAEIANELKRRSAISAALAERISAAATNGEVTNDHQNNEGLIVS